MDLFPCSRIGSIVISQNLTLKLVLLVPKLTCDLLFVSKLTKDLKYVAKSDGFLPSEPLKRLPG